MADMPLWIVWKRQRGTKSLDRFFFFAARMNFQSTGAHATPKRFVHRNPNRQLQTVHRISGPPPSFLPEMDMQIDSSFQTFSDPKSCFRTKFSFHNHDLMSLKVTREQSETSSTLHREKPRGMSTLHANVAKQSNLFWVQDRPIQSQNGSTKSMSVDMQTRLPLKKGQDIS